MKDIAGRPKGSTNKSQVLQKDTDSAKPSKKSISKKSCLSCPPEQAEQVVRNFYVSYSKMHQDGLLPYCKSCIQKKSYDFETDDIDIEKFKNLLRQIDKPFISSILQSSIDQYNKTYGGKYVEQNNRIKIIGYYFKNIQTLRQYVTMNWQEGLLWEEKANKRSSGGVTTKIEETYEMKLSKSKDNNEEKYILDEDKNFKVTKDIIRLFGSGYKKLEYKAMWDKYLFLKQNYSDVTNLHVEALLTYVRFKVKEEIATASGDVVEAEKWNNAATKAAEKAKISPSQLSQSDLQGGLNSFCELFQAVEEAVDVIPILPQFKCRPNDSIDFNILCFVNYIRDLEGKPLCKYEDIYKFYDRRKAEYIEQYGDPLGIFLNDTTEKNRENIKKFITLPPDYNENISSCEEAED